MDFLYYSFSLGFIFFNFYLFTFGHAASSLLCRLSLVAASRGYSLLWCSDFSLQGLLLLWSVGLGRACLSSCSSQALEHRLSSCHAWASLLRSTWDHPGSGIEPVSPALAVDSSPLSLQGSPSHFKT